MGSGDGENRISRNRKASCGKSSEGRISGMRRRRKRKRKEYTGAILTAFAVLFGISMFFSVEGAAAEKGDIVAVKLPVMKEGESSPFDFFLDPCGLLYETDAVRYGGGMVEEGATLLFENSEGEYRFSRYSDKLTAVNESGAPVRITIEASVSNLNEIELRGHSDFSEDQNPAIYLAVVDDQGNEQPIYADRSAVISVELAEGAYSFGLMGACNPDAQWWETSVCPRVTVTWQVEPALMKEEPEAQEEQEEPGQGMGSNSEDGAYSQDDVGDVSGNSPASEEVTDSVSGGDRFDDGIPVK